MKIADVNMVKFQEEMPSLSLIEGLDLPQNCKPVIGIVTMFFMSRVKPKLLLKHLLGFIQNVGFDKSDLLPQNFWHCQHSCNFLVPSGNVLLCEDLSRVCMFP